MDASSAEEQKERERAVFNNEDDDESDSSDSDSDSSNNPNPNQIQQPPVPTQTTTAVTTTTAPVTPAGPPSSDIIVAAPVEERRPLSFSAYDESRRLFQRLWTDDDEIKILQGFFQFTSKRGTTFASHQYDTGPFYEDIKLQLNLDFTKNQLIEKLRRLKKKYRNCVSRMRSLGKDFSFKSAHERAIYDIARNIWSASVKRVRDSDDEENLNSNLNNPNDLANVTLNDNSIPVKVSSGGASSRKRLRRKLAEESANVVIGNENSMPAMNAPPLQTVPAVVGVPGVVEETVKSCLSPLFKELISSAIASPFGSSSPGGGGVAAGSPLNLIPMGIGTIPSGAAAAGSDEKWKKQQILELEVYLKRIELVRDHIKEKLEEMRSSES